jgi:uncharacterized YccA/Bax inhibitor family protein
MAAKTVENGKYSPTIIFISPFLEGFFLGCISLFNRPGVAGAFLQTAL